MWPQLQMYSVFGSTDPTHTNTHTQTMVPKTEAGLLTQSKNAPTLHVTCAHVQLIQMTELQQQSLVKTSETPRMN